MPTKYKVARRERVSEIGNKIDYFSDMGRTEKIQYHLNNCEKYKAKEKVAKAELKEVNAKLKLVKAQLKEDPKSEYKRRKRSGLEKASKALRADIVSCQDSLVASMNALKVFGVIKR